MVLPIAHIAFELKSGLVEIMLLIDSVKAFKKHITQWILKESREDAWKIQETNEAWIFQTIVSSTKQE